MKIYNRIFTKFKNSQLCRYMQLREENAHWIDNVNPLNLTVLGDENIMTTTPYRDQTGKRMLIYRFGNWKPSKLSVDEIFKGWMSSKPSKFPFYNSSSYFQPL